MLIVNAARCSKVDQLNDRVFLVFEVNVFRLDVAVYDAALMQVIDGGEQLFNDMGCLYLVEVLVSSNTLIKCSTVAHFIDKVDLFFVLVHFDYLADVRVVKLLKKFNLFKKLATLAKLEIFLSHNFDGSSDPRNSVNSTTHPTQGSFANDLVKIIVILYVVLM